MDMCIYICVCVCTNCVNIQIDSHDTRNKKEGEKNLVVYQRLELDGRIDRKAINNNGVDEVRQVVAPLVSQNL